MNSATKGHLLIVDDEAALRRAYSRKLRELGYSVDEAADGETAVHLVKSSRYDAVVSDISMPGMSGLSLLRIAREVDLDVPFILITGFPQLDTAIQAVEYGAMRYLTKPFELAQLTRVIGQAVGLRKLAELKRQAISLIGEEAKGIGDRIGLEVTFGKALQNIQMAFQPIIQWSTREVFAYEALVRSTEKALSQPMALFDAAERLGRLNDLGRQIRTSVSHAFLPSSSSFTLFVNLHPRDLLDEDLFRSDAPLSDLSKHVVLELTERATLDDIQDVASRVAAIRSMGYRLALDDLGAGYAGLNLFAQLEPDVVKLDMALIRDVDKKPTQRKLIHAMTTVCQELGMMVIAEGVETTQERDTLIQLGCDFLQGFLFAKPGTPIPKVEF